MAQFEIAYKKTRRHEGGWCNVPGDSGGETYGGCARNFFPYLPLWTTIDELKKRCEFDKTKNVHALNKTLAKSDAVQNALEQFYREYFWDKARLSDFKSQIIADEVFDTLVNTGRTGAHILQRVLNAYNFDGKNPYADDLVIDGIIGEKTIALMGLIISKRKLVNGDIEEKLFQRLNELQGTYYVDLCNAKPHLRKFIDGWDRRIMLDIELEEAYS